MAKHGLTRGGFLRHMLGDMAGVALGAEAVVDFLKEPQAPEQKPASIQSVTEFWRVAGKALPYGRRVTLLGVLSPYAPVFVDAPQRKRAIHRRFRRLDTTGKGVELDMLLAVSAGQMVIRYKLEQDSPHVFLGLYHSIVRNSIPVLIERSYYETCVAELFATRRTAAEVELTGHVIDISGDPVSTRLRDLAAHRFQGAVAKALHDPSAPAADQKTYALSIDGHEHTGVTPVKGVEARYLDGDIWVALQDKNGQEHLLSRFVDIADPDDLGHECRALRTDAEKYVDGGQFIMSYDMLNPMFPENA